MRDIRAKFGSFTLRSVDPSIDRVTLEAWIDEDQYHRMRMNPEFFLGDRQVGGIWVPDPRPGCYAVEDEKGLVLFMRLSRASRVHMQFMPMTGLLPRTRTAAALLHLMRFLQVGLARAGAEEWIFATESPALLSLAKNRLGFTESPHELVKPIDYLDPVEPQQGASQAQEGGK